MGRQRSHETRERDAEAVNLRRRGLSYPQIATQLGIAVSSAHAAVKRGMKDLFREEHADAQVLELERLDDALRTVYRVMMGKHVATNNAGIIYDKTGQAVIDESINLSAALALRTLSESRRKLLGLDAPARSRVEVITEDVIDEAARQLAAQRDALTAEVESYLADQV